MGWVQTRRDFGALVFVDLRDSTGLMQVVFDESVLEGDFDRVNALRSEYVIAVRGKIVRRDPETVNEKLPTGFIELKARELKVLSKAQTPPFEIEDDTAVREELRLKYRYLDLRRPPMQRNIMMRSRISAAARDYLVETAFSISRRRCSPRARPRARATIWCRRASIRAASTRCRSPHRL